MKKYRSNFLILCISALLLISSCSTDDVKSPLSESIAATAQPSFDQTAIILAEVLEIAHENNWFDQSELITGLLKSGMSHSPSEIEAIETNLGIPYDEFNRLILELGTATSEYTRAMTALNLTDEELTSVIHNAVASSTELESLRSTMVDAQGRCFLQDVCYFIGGVAIEVYLFICEPFLGWWCQEEVLPLYLLIQEICQMFPC